MIQDARATVSELCEVRSAEEYATRLLECEVLERLHREAERAGDRESARMHSYVLEQMRSALATYDAVNGRR